MPVGAVPHDVAELIAKYDPFIYYTIRRVVPRISPEDLEDLRADVLHRIVARDYLQRCREYASAQTSYSFLSSLRALTERAAKNYLRYIGAKRRAAVTVSLDELTDSPVQNRRAATNLNLYTLDHKTPRQIVAGLDLRDRVQKLRAHLQARNRVIGGVPATQVLDRMVQGEDLPRYMKTRLQVYAKQQAEEWQRVG